MDRLIIPTFDTTKKSNSNVNVLAKLETIIVNDKWMSLYVSDFLNASSIFNLRLVNRLFKQTTDQWKQSCVFSKRSEKYFKLVIGSSADKFLNILLSSRAFVSGSLLLQILEGFPETLLSNDCDIYTMDQQTQNENMQTQNNYFQYSKIEDFLWETINFSEENYHWLESKSYPDFDEKKPEFKVREYQTARMKFDVIKIGLTECKNIKEWIIENFDLDFLHNTFDGKNLIVYGMQSIRTKTSNYKPFSINLLGCHMNRIEKYEKRGFIVPNINVKQKIVTCRDLKRDIVVWNVFKNEKHWETLLKEQDVIDLYKHSNRDTLIKCLRKSVISFRGTPIIRWRDIFGVKTFTFSPPIL